MRGYTEDREKLARTMGDWLDAYQGDTVCVRQIWYQGLGGQGVPDERDMAAMYAVMDSLENWQDIGVKRHEIFGQQQMYKRVGPAVTGQDGHIMVQHMFKVGGRYKTPDGTVYQIVLSEVYNLRCFEVQGDQLVGTMVRIDPRSDLAKSMVEA